MPAVIAQPGFWVDEPSLGIDLLSIFHGEQKVTLHRRLPTEGDIAGQSRISEVIDRGAGKGALIFVETKLSDQATGALLCTIERSAFLRNEIGTASCRDSGCQYVYISVGAVSEKKK